ncbi:hypothetical protein RJ639_017319 [Escallonia herrerae]|uniref:Uncharacterized protein n=1 Tax=Escallonia herrerae TaxID=1293975 RepID=A0AA88VCT7_9ASTE|nr:hypothetical protein RJ639_017319 [Escallonia herrerae]
MAHVMRPLLWWPKWHLHCRSPARFRLLFNSPPSLPAGNSRNRLVLTGIPFSHRTDHFRSPAVRLADAPTQTELSESDGESDSSARKSRNEKKREARQAVRWGMELATFSVPQIKRIIRLASLEPEVLDALVLVKRLGRDVREGKRRQFSYIGKLLREVQPELMDDLIQATKDGDLGRFQALTGSDKGVIDDDDADDEEAEEPEYDDEEEGSHIYVDMATRWFDGLISKDIDITNEIYSVHNVDFDRQELRRLVRKVHSAAQERLATSEENEGKDDKALVGAKRSLTCFLRALAKQLPTV